MKNTIPIILAIVLLCGCIQEQQTTTTTTTEATTTTTEATTTTTKTTTTTTSTSSTTTVPEVDALCAEYCTNATYLSGVCRVSRFECEVRIEDKAETRDKLCPRTLSTCCCRTNESIEKDIHYKYVLP